MAVLGVFDLAIHIAIIFPFIPHKNYILTSSQVLNYMHLLFISSENCILLLVKQKRS